MLKRWACLLERGELEWGGWPPYLQDKRHCGQPGVYIIAIVALSMAYRMSSTIPVAALVMKIGVS